MGEDVRASIEIDADPDVVYAAVSDVPNLPLWASETVSCRWLDGASTAAVGARFRGVNRRGPLRWWTTLTVTAAQPGRRFAWRVTAAGSPIAEWSYDIEPVGSGCRVTERTADLRNAFFRRVVGPLGTGVADRSEHNRRNIERTLQALSAYVSSPRGGRRTDSA